MRDGRPEQVTAEASRGVGIRVLGAKTWGFACTADTSEGALLAAAARALAIARASAVAVQRARGVPGAGGLRGAVRDPARRRPLPRARSRQARRLDAPVRALRAGDERLVVGRGVDGLDAPATSASSPPRAPTPRSRSRSARAACTSSPSATTASRSVAATRRGRAATGSREATSASRALDLDGARRPRERRGARAARRAALPRRHARRSSSTRARSRCRSTSRAGTRRSSIACSGSEISLAGGSFLQPRCSASCATARRSSPWSPTRRAPAATAPSAGTTRACPRASARSSTRGLFVDYLSSRETAAALGRASTGTMRAEGWNRAPIIRMVNVSLEPARRARSRTSSPTPTTACSSPPTRAGASTTCASTSSSRARSPGRSSAASARASCATRSTPASRRGSGARATRSAAPGEWRLWGITTCGKGDPMQSMQVGHGASPARFRGVTVGSAS